MNNSKFLKSNNVLTIQPYILGSYYLVEWILQAKGCFDVFCAIVVGLQNSSLLNIVNYFGAGEINPNIFNY